MSFGGFHLSLVATDPSKLQASKLKSSQLIDSNNPDQVSSEQMDEYYQQVNEAMNEQWKEYGRHAYFHHLNAMYGYVPVYINESGQYHTF